MPPKNTKKTYRRKRLQKRYTGQKKNNKYANNKITFTRTSAPFDPRRGTCLSLTRELQFSTTTALHRQILYCNSLYDPWNTGGVVNQPRGFDQLAQIYTEYRVHAVKVTTVVTATYNTPIQGESPTCIVGLHYYHNASNAPSDIRSVIEDPQCDYKIFKGNTTISRYLPMTRVFNRSKATMNGEKNYASGIGASPSLLGAVNILVQGIDASTQQIDFNTYTTVCFYSEFNSPAYLSSS